MRSWTIKEAKLALNWAAAPEQERISLEELAAMLDRSPDGVRGFLRRSLPPGERPWHEKPRWAPLEVEALKQGTEPTAQRSAVAIKKYAQRHLAIASPAPSEEELERASVPIPQLARDLGISRSAVYRLLRRGLLRRFKGDVAETSFHDLLRKHPEAIPYSRLSREHREWLVLNGYSDPTLVVKPPSVKGLLD